ncbi:VOC family protein [Anaeromyxobacter paludicola]|uniref:Glyoxalase n=1 Tax=Anaeromyxobacter paludicola TaxID=2918171 RepID=A0ABM7X9M1_9BACT|nr:VOC family protein [Anaeromyxobacter paludicola]BDG08551.1 glyoxalase [Anaeromyxobacter paludicola]
MASANVGSFVWYEHLTRDVPAAVAFYSEVVGWKTQPFNADYVMWVGSQGPLGGVMALTDELAQRGVPPHWMAHVQVADVDATARLAAELGGKVHKPPTDIPTVGRFAVLGDPQGAVLSTFAPNQGDMAPHDPARPGEFCWSELMTTDHVAGFDFYAKLFGWKLLDEMDMGPMGTYRIFGLGERRLGGMMRIPQGAPRTPGWLYYTSTDDLAGAVARATGKGGKLLNGPMDVPGGRIAQLLDPQGAAFALHEARKQAP